MFSTLSLRVALVLGVVFVGTSVAMDTIINAQITDPRERALILNLHNEARAQTNLPPLVWSDKFAAFADAYQRKMFEREDGRHEINTCRGDQACMRRVRDEGGENIAATSQEGDRVVPATPLGSDERLLFFRQRVVDWISEKNTCTGTIGHYKQLMSVRVTAVGCAWASGLHISKTSLFHGAHYDPFTKKLWSASALLCRYDTMINEFEDPCAVAQRGAAIDGAECGVPLGASQPPACTSSQQCKVVGGTHGTEKACVAPSVTRESFLESTRRLADPATVKKPEKVVFNHNEHANALAEHASDRGTRFQVGAVTQPGDQRLIVALHDEQRAFQGSSGVKWSSTLAKHANKWLTYVMKKNLVNHERHERYYVSRKHKHAHKCFSVSGNGCLLRPEGENIATLFRWTDAANENQRLEITRRLVTTWMVEKLGCGTRTMGHDSTGASKAVLGHWKTAVNPKVTHVGCAFATTEHWLMGGVALQPATMLLCRYNDAAAEDVECVDDNRVIDGTMCKIGCPPGRQCLDVKNWSNRVHSIMFANVCMPPNTESKDWWASTRQLAGLPPLAEPIDGELTPGQRKQQAELARLRALGFNFAEANDDDALSAVDGADASMMLSSSLSDDL